MSEQERAVARAMITEMTATLDRTRKASPEELAHCFGMACDKVGFIPTKESADRVLKMVAARLVDLTATVDRIKTMRRR
ncbi:hypothetical protein [Bradyrhizobium tropiciagri]|uniref:hypothetical protein n=1 Tax=Bradyrhizobium tropiciagri TaxID=312253 RepID=UPI00067D45A3|nr:hypothetical protein [Bradyrhizobium tropiciagri]